LRAELEITSLLLSSQDCIQQLTKSPELLFLTSNAREPRDGRIGRLSSAISASRSPVTQPAEMRAVLGATLNFHAINRVVAGGGLPDRGGPRGALVFKIHEV
jgi:hypothetical protein